MKLNSSLIGEAGDDTIFFFKFMSENASSGGGRSGWLLWLTDLLVFVRECELETLKVKGEPGDWWPCVTDEDTCASSTLMLGGMTMFRGSCLSPFGCARLTLLIPSRSLSAIGMFMFGEKGSRSNTGLLMFEKEGSVGVSVFSPNPERETLARLRSGRWDCEGIGGRCC